MSETGEFTDVVLKTAALIREAVVDDGKNPIEESVGITAGALVIVELAVGDGKKNEDKRSALLEIVGTLFDRRLEFIRRVFKTPEAVPAPKGKT